MVKWIIELWEDYSGYVYLITCIGFIVLLLVFNFAWSLRYEFNDVITIHEIVQTDKGNWRVMYAETNGRWGAKVEDEVFGTYEGAMSFVERYNEEYRKLAELNK